jgi:hypothetical protein
MISQKQKAQGYNQREEIQETRLPSANSSLKILVFFKDPLTGILYFIRVQNKLYHQNVPTKLVTGLKLNTKGLNLDR